MEQLAKFGPPAGSFGDSALLTNTPTLIKLLWAKAEVPQARPEPQLN
jgi:hypothetical protein